MSNKNIKKIRKEVRRETRVILGEGMEAMGKFLKARPKYIPKFVWIIPFLCVFKKESWKFLYKHI